MLMTAGSTSTWPKSGLTVGSRVRLLFRPALKSKPALAGEFAAGPERIAGLRRAEAGLCRGVGNDLEPPARVDVADPDEVGEAGNETALLLGYPGEQVLLVLPLDVALEVDAPDIGVLLLEAELVEGDAHLHRPARSSIRAALSQMPSQVGSVLSSLKSVPSTIEPAGLTREEIAAPAVVIGIDAEDRTSPNRRSRRGGRAGR